MQLADSIQLGILAVAAFAIVVSLRAVRDQLWLHTFSEYTRRYLDVMDSLPDVTRLPSPVALSSLPADEQTRVFVAMRRYFNLCSEEFYLHQRRRIDAETWRIWTAGIRNTMSLPAFAESWQRIGPEYAYFSEFHAFMDEVARSSRPRQTDIPLVPVG